MVFGLLSTYYLVGQKTGDYSLINGYLGLFTGFITVAYTIIILLYISYRCIFKKDRFDFYPLFSFGLVVWVFFSIKISEPKTGEIYIKAEMRNGIDNEKYKNVELLLGKKGIYELGFHDSHYGCREKGKYMIIGDSLILNRKSDKCMYQGDYNVLRIDKINSKIYLYNETSIDSTEYFEIKK
jgi:hypothetical protein